MKVEGRNIDVVFGVSSKLGKIISKLGVEKIERQISDDLKPFGGAEVVIHEPDINKRDMIGDLKSTSIEDEEYSSEEAEDVTGAEDPYLEQLKKAIEKTTGQDVNVITGEESLNEKVDLERVKRVSRGLIGAAGLAGAVAAGSNFAPKAYDAGSEIVGAISDISTGNREFFSKLSTEDAKKLKAAMQNVRDAGKDVALAPNAGVIKRYYDDAKDYLDIVVADLRRDNQIGPEVKFQFNEGASYTSSYLTEQTKNDSVRRTQTQQNLTFKDKYKPKTSWQLEELRRYGL